MWHLFLYIKKITKLSPVKEAISSQNIRKVLKRYVWSVTSKHFVIPWVCDIWNSLSFQMWFFIINKYSFSCVNTSFDIFNILCICKGGVSQIVWYAKKSWSVLGYQRRLYWYAEIWINQEAGKSPGEMFSK